MTELLRRFQGVEDQMGPSPKASLGALPCATFSLPRAGRQSCHEPDEMNFRPGERNPSGRVHRPVAA